MKEIKNLTRCENGHFYDGNKFETCPHCGNTTPGSDTVAFSSRNPQFFVSTPVQEEPATSVEKPVKKDVFPEPVAEVQPERTTKQETVYLGSGKPADDSVTVHYYQKTLGTKPVVGWVVCTDGTHKGEDFRIESGRNFIGRSGSMNICLAGDVAVSRENHSIITYDPKGNMFFVQPGNTSELTYLNDKPLLTVAELKSGDKITVGQSDLIFVPFCGDQFTWEQ